MKQTLNQHFNHFPNGQEQTRNITSEFPKSTTRNQMIMIRSSLIYQISQMIETVETENSIDDLLQAKQQKDQQYRTIEVETVEKITQSSKQQQQLKSTDIPIKIRSYY